MTRQLQVPLSASTGRRPRAVHDHVGCQSQCSRSGHRPLSFSLIHLHIAALVLAHRRSRLFKIEERLCSTHHFNLGRETARMHSVAIFAHFQQCNTSAMRSLEPRCFAGPALSQLLARTSGPRAGKMAAMTRRKARFRGTGR